jgi:hypothetical protein
MAFLSFTRVVLFLFACLLSYYAYSMYLIFNPAQCTSKSRGSCLRPVYPSHLPLELWVYVSEKQLVQKEKMELLWREKSLLRNSSVTKYRKKPSSSIYSIFPGPQGRECDPPYLHSEEWFTLCTCLSDSAWSQSSPRQRPTLHVCLRCFPHPLCRSQGYDL